MRPIYRNTVIITSVHNKRGKQFAFGVILEERPRTVFFPSWIVQTFDLQREDQGLEFDCCFIDQEEDKHPLVIAIIDEDMALGPSMKIGTYEGRPGGEDFSAIVTLLNRKERA